MIAVHALQTSRDLKRKSDLQSISVAMNVLLMESNDDLYAKIPKNATDIGTAQGLVNLVSYLVPSYIDVMPKDPINGTDADTKYSIMIDKDNKLVLRATSEANPSIPIELIR